MTIIKNYLSLVKFSHTIFAMPFALIGFFLGAQSLSFSNPINYHGLFEFSDKGFYVYIFFLILICMVTARSAAMAFNRYLDRNFDSRNPRTAVREIPAGIIKAKSALLFTIVNCVLFMIATFFINSLCFYLSPIALFVILFYSYTKRFTPLCHLVLGLGLSLAPIGAYIAVTGSFALIPILLSVAVICWVSGFDIIYALQDEGFDKENQLYSIPSVLGKEKALNVSTLLHVISAAAVITVGVMGYFGIWYWIGIAVFIGMLLYQHSIVKPNDLSKVNLAFMTANGIASVVFAVFVITDIFLS